MACDVDRSDEWLDTAVVVPIADVLDLHFYRPREIVGIVDAYLDAAIERGLREVRLVHGRGKGVQRARIQQMLRSDPRVLRWQDAPPERGGWGATLAWLDVGPEPARASTGDPAPPPPDRQG